VKNLMDLQKGSKLVYPRPISLAIWPNDDLSFPIRTPNCWHGFAGCDFPNNLD
jgi:hypothetical protein